MAEVSVDKKDRIKVHIAQNNLKAGGIGEPVFPSVGPAVANTVFRATGVRLRELALSNRSAGIMTP